MKNVIVGTKKEALTKLIYSTSVITVSGDMGAGSAKLVFSTNHGGFVDVPDGTLSVGDVITLVHGKGNFPYIDTTDVTELVVNCYGV